MPRHTWPPWWDTIHSTFASLFTKHKLKELQLSRFLHSQQMVCRHTTLAISVLRAILIIQTFSPPLVHQVLIPFNASVQKLVIGHELQALLVQFSLQLNRLWNGTCLLKLNDATWGFILYCLLPSTTMSLWKWHQPIKSENATAKYDKHTETILTIVANYLFFMIHLNRWRLPINFDWDTLKIRL
jgi:hypothetical protein